MRQARRSARGPRPPLSARIREYRDLPHDISYAPRPRAVVTRAGDWPSSARMTHRLPQVVAWAADQLDNPRTSMPGHDRLGSTAESPGLRAPPRHPPPVLVDGPCAYIYR